MCFCLLLTVVKFSARLSHVILSTAVNTGPVTAVTSLGGKVFVIREYSEQVEVYDATTCTLQRHVRIPGLGVHFVGPWGLAACAHYQCLYASDLTYNRIHRAELTGSKAVKEWSVAGGPRGLSVNKAHM